MDTSSENVIKHIVRVINTILFKEKKKVFNFREVSLYPSEVHLMMMIKTEMDTNATKIAKQLGVTKGAISQTIARLEKKGIILKVKDPYNKNQLTLSLTGFGKEAFKYCRSHEEAFIKAHQNYIAKLDSEEKKVILNFLRHMEDTIADLDLS